MTTEVEPESHPSDLDDHALEAVPSNRRQSLTQMIVVQIGWNISVSSFLVGGVVGGGPPSVRAWPRSSSATWSWSRWPR